LECQFFLKIGIDLFYHYISHIILPISYALIFIFSTGCSPSPPNPPFYNPYQVGRIFLFSALSGHMAFLQHPGHHQSGQSHSYCQFTDLCLPYLIYNRFEGYPRSILILDGIFHSFSWEEPDSPIRIHYSNKTPRDFFPFLGSAYQAKPLLIIGAGQAGEKVIREINDNPKIRFLSYRFS